MLEIGMRVHVPWEANAWSGGIVVALEEETTRIGKEIVEVLDLRQFQMRSSCGWQKNWENLFFLQNFNFKAACRGF